jgi:hypothetical protein
MRTTIRIKDDLLRRAKKKAAEEGATLTSIIEEGLTLALNDSNPKRKEWITLPVSKATGGVRPGIDLNCSADLWEILDFD